MAGPGTARTDGRAIATVGRALLMPLCTRATRMGFVHTRMGLSMIECSMNTDELLTDHQDEIEAVRLRARRKGVDGQSGQR